MAQEGLCHTMFRHPGDPRPGAAIPGWTDRRPDVLVSISHQEVLEEKNQLMDAYFGC
jgi:hypothetical protein